MATVLLGFMLSAAVIFCILFTFALNHGSRVLHILGVAIGYGIGLIIALVKLVKGTLCQK